MYGYDSVCTNRNFSQDYKMESKYKETIEKNDMSQCVYNKVRSIKCHKFKILKNYWRKGWKVTTQRILVLKMTYFRRFGRDYLKDNKLSGAWP